MGVPNVSFTWRSIKVLRAIVSTMSAIGLIVIFAGIMWAIKLRRDIGDYLNLAVPGDGHLWPTVIVVAAVPCAPVYLLGLKAYLCLNLGIPRNNKCCRQFEEDDSEHSDFQDSPDDVVNNDKNNGLEANRILFLHAILCLISGCLVGAINVACFLKSTTFQEKIREDGSFDNLIEAMNNYAYDDRVRSYVDAVQMEFQCCGSEDYRDWFHVSWWAKRSTEYFDYEDNERQQEGGRQSMEKKDEGKIATVFKDVPFSCCTNKFVEPCGHREILRASQVCNFGLNKEETVWNVGCRSIILTHARVIGLFLIFFLICLSLYQFLLGILSRLVQTAHSNEFYIGPEKLYYRAWIFSNTLSPCSKHYTNLFQESDEDTIETRSLLQETLESSPPSPPSPSPPSPSPPPPPPPIIVASDKRNSNKRKRQQEHKFVLTPRGSVQLLQIDRLRKIRSSPILSTNEPIKNTYKQDDNDSLLEKSDTSIRANLKFRENKNLSNAVIAPVPPPFPPQSEEYEEKRNFDNTRNKIEQEFISKPSKQDRQKLLNKFEQIFKIEERNRRESGGADVPRPWEQLVQRSIDSPDKVNHSSRESEKSHVLSRFQATDAYDRFRGTLQDTLSRRENPHLQNRTTIRRSARPGRMCPCCSKRNHQHFNGNNVDSEDYRIVQRTNLLPDIPCPPTPPAIPLALHDCTSPRYPRPTLIRLQQQEQRRQQRQCHLRNFQRNVNDNKHQPPPWTLAATSFSHPSNNNCIHCQTRHFLTTNKQHYRRSINSNRFY